MASAFRGIAHMGFPVFPINIVGVNISDEHMPRSRYREEDQGFTYSSFHNGGSLASQA